ncbi:hypothetical protein D3C78_1688690 [compost metagenome]
MRVGPRKVTVEGAGLALAGLQQQRNVAGLQALRAVTDEGGQTAGGDLPMQLGEIGLIEGGGQVHGGGSCGAMQSS